MIYDLIHFILSCAKLLWFDKCIKFLLREKESEIKRKTGREIEDIKCNKINEKVRKRLREPKKNITLTI